MSEKKPGNARGCLIAIAIVVLVFIFVVGSCTYLVTTNIDKIARQGSASAIVVVGQAMLAETSLTDEQKKEIMDPLKDFSQRIRDGEVTLVQGMGVMESMMTGPVAVAIMSLSVEQQYLATSGLSTDELAAARITISRFGRGVIEQRIPQEKIDSVVDQIVIKSTDASGEEKYEFRESLSDDEIRSLLAQAKGFADEAQIPNEIYKVDLAKTIKEAIDEGMKKTDWEDIELKDN